MRIPPGSAHTPKVRQNGQQDRPPTDKDDAPSQPEPLPAESGQSVPASGYSKAGPKARSLDPRESAVEDTTNRVTYLLNKGYEACQVDDQKEYPNCLGTALWAVGLDPDPEPKNVNNSDFIGALQAGGYREAATHHVLHTEDAVYEEDFSKIKEPAKATVHLEDVKLHSGDVLVFGAVDEAGNHPTHAAIYVGKVNGQDMVFQKDSMYCGTGSPYHMLPLREVVAGEAKRFLRGSSDHFTHLSVYQK